MLVISLLLVTLLFHDNVTQYESLTFADISSRHYMRQCCTFCDVRTASVSWLGGQSAAVRTCILHCCTVEHSIAATAAAAAWVHLFILFRQWCGWQMYEPRVNILREIRSNVTNELALWCVKFITVLLPPMWRQLNCNWDISDVPAVKVKDNKWTVYLNRNYAFDEKSATSLRKKSYYGAREGTSREKKNI